MSWVAPLPCLIRAGVVFNADGRRLGEEAESFVAAFAADAALLDAAKGRTQVTQKPAIDPHRPALEALGHAVRTVQVAGPERGRQAKGRGIGVADDLLF